MNKKKTILAVLCGIMVLGIGTGAALADGEKATEGKTAIVEMDDSGKGRISEDGGATWTDIDESELQQVTLTTPDGQPEGVAGELQELHIQTDEEGNMKYSTDGENWIDGLPEGAEVQFSANGEAVDISHKLEAAE